MEIGAIVPTMNTTTDNIMKRKRASEESEESSVPPQKKKTSPWRRAVKDFEAICGDEIPLFHEDFCAGDSNLDDAPCFLSFGIDASGEMVRLPSGIGQIKAPTTLFIFWGSDPSIASPFLCLPPKAFVDARLQIKEDCGAIDDSGPEDWMDALESAGFTWSGGPEGVATKLGTNVEVLNKLMTEAEKIFKQVRINDGEEEEEEDE